jgi:hypothetical protein
MKLLKTKICECGKEITEKNLAPGWLLIQAEKGFLGGKRVRFKEAVCPCGKEYVALMLTDGNNFKFTDLVKIEPVEELPFEPPKEPAKTKAEERKELIAQAKALGIEGKIATMKTETLIEKIKEAQHEKEN